MTKKYFLHIACGWFVRVPRWLYNRWPVGGLVEMSNHSSNAACNLESYRCEF